jgi:hypothetical protein
MEEIPWPYNIDDVARAIHYALDKDCGYSNLLNCMDISHRTILATLTEYAKWRDYRAESSDQLLSANIANHRAY